MRARAAFIDALLRGAVAARCSTPTWPQRLALVAVGGYGRGELHPCSDVDILVLVPGAAGRRPSAAQVEQLVTFLWDIGLEVGHSVRTVAECAEESAADVGVMTTLLEARLLAGYAALLRGDARRAGAGPRLAGARRSSRPRCASSSERHLQGQRHRLQPRAQRQDRPGRPARHPDHRLGGQAPLRRRDRSTSWSTHGFLTPAELRRLKQAQAFLWKVRFGLHVLTGRHEDRLLFDHQIRLAQSFGYEDATYTLAVEQLMQRYYRTVHGRQLLNELLLQLFREAILADDTPPQAAERALPGPQRLPRGRRATTCSRASPSALLELFVLLQQNPQLRGVRASTMRAVARNLWLIDEEFRQNPRHHRLFLEILRAPRGVTHELRRMNNYGVLGRYIPAFGRIVGRMQYDLFHAYTVDAHTLFVVSNLRRLAMPQVRPRAAAGLADHAAAAEAGDRLPGGAVPRHRQGPRRRSLRARRGGRRGLLPRAGPVALRRAPGRLAGAQPPAAVDDRAEAGHRRPAGHQRIRAPGRRRGAPRLPVRADLRRRARHQPEAVEFLEGLAVPGLLRDASSARCAAAWKARSTRTS